ncbi:hypothetical protein RRL34_004252 [Vibrio parahaemolyticus]|nr:hypothetical protein [Vibrio parahaemolyticus]
MKDYFELDTEIDIDFNIEDMSQKDIDILSNKLYLVSMLSLLGQKRYSKLECRSIIFGMDDQVDENLLNATQRDTIKIIETKERELNQFEKIIIDNFPNMKADYNFLSKSADFIFDCISGDDAANWKRIFAENSMRDFETFSEWKRNAIYKHSLIPSAAADVVRIEYEPQTDLQKKIVSTFPNMIYCSTLDECEDWIINSVKCVDYGSVWRQAFAAHKMNDFNSWYDYRDSVISTKQDILKSALGLEKIINETDIFI